MKEEIPNWVMYDEQHVMDTNTGRIVLKGKQHDYTRDDIKGYDKLDKERVNDLLDLAYGMIASMSEDNKDVRSILKSIDETQEKVRELI